MNTLLFLINTLYQVIVFLIFVRAIISWFRPNFYNPTWRSLLKFLYDITEPILGPIRRVLPTGSMGVDFSPLIAFILLYVIRSFLVSLIINISRDIRF
jgi:YggT family protein